MRALSEPEREWLQKIHQKLMEMIDLSQIGRLDNKQARNQIRELAERIMDELAVPLNVSTRQFLATCIEDEILGLGPIEPLLAEPSIFVIDLFQVYCDSSL
jgi:pilus assembly protein CpaF